MWIKVRELGNGSNTLLPARKDNQVNCCVSSLDHHGSLNGEYNMYLRVSV